MKDNELIINGRELTFPEGLNYFKPFIKVDEGFGYQCIYEFVNQSREETIFEFGSPINVI